MLEVRQLRGPDRFDEWTEAGVWPKLRERLLNRLGKAGGIDLDRVVVDISRWVPSKGAITPAPTPRTAARPAARGTCWPRPTACRWWCGPRRPTSTTRRNCRRCRMPCPPCGARGAGPGASRAPSPIRSCPVACRMRWRTSAQISVLPRMFRRGSGVYYGKTVGARARAQSVGAIKHWVPGRAWLQCRIGKAALGVAPGHSWAQRRGSRVVSEGLVVCKFGGSLGSRRLRATGV